MLAITDAKRLTMRMNDEVLLLEIYYSLRKIHSTINNSKTEFLLAKTLDQFSSVLRSVESKNSEPNEITPSPSQCEIF